VSKDVTGWVPVREFPWPASDEIGGLFELTCRNHPSAKYLTKHPMFRSLHLIEVPDDVAPEHRTKPFGECDCPFGDLIVKPKGES
jgi:hypothetical protein